MSENVHLSSRYRIWGYELFFSVYFALLLVSINQVTAESSWVWRLRTFYISHRFPHAHRGIDDAAGVRFTSFILVWLVAVILCATFRLLASFPSARIGLSILVGTVSVAGLPLAHLYSGHREMFFLEVEVFLAVICVLVYTFGRWPRSKQLKFALLFVHFALWAVVFWNSFSLDLDVLWPAWDRYWLTYVNGGLSFVLLAVCSTLCWGAYMAEFKHCKRLGVASSTF